MPYYKKMGIIPPKRHIIFPNKNNSYLNEGIYYEHVVTTQGFDRAYSVLYHLRPPTLTKSVELVKEINIEPCDKQPLRHHHFLSAEMKKQGDPITGRVPLMYNQDLIAYRCNPLTKQETIFRNAAADEVIFIHHGSGIIKTHYGNLKYKDGDFVIMPRTTNYLIIPDDPQKDQYLILECNSIVEIPERYKNTDGQIMLGAPYYERDFHGPSELQTIDQFTETPVLVKEKNRLTKMNMANHPFDVVGWDGYLYPYIFNANDFEPLTGTVHLPPPAQQVFQCVGFVICAFVPRYLDHHPQAIKVPYAHSNVEADEVLFYTRGQFGSRKGVSSGSLTLHPGGIPHGPHPGTIQKSMDQDRTNELAIMFDTDNKLQITKQAMQMDDPTYPLTWL